MAVMAANSSAAGPTIAENVVPSTPAPPPPASATARGARLVPMTVALVVATLAGIAVAAGAPWREESGRSTSARAQTANDQIQQEHAAAVRSICNGVNAENGALPERFQRLKRRLGRGEATLRVALIEEINRQLRAGDSLLARLEATSPANARALALQAGTAAATWSRSLDRLRSLRDALERARSERAVVRAATALSRSAAERDRRRTRAGLLALGGTACRLDPLPDLPRIERRGREVAPPAAEPTAGPQLQELPPTSPPPTAP
jgi:hypothetical protein